MPVECKGVFSATKRMFNASCKIHTFLEWVILTFLWYLFFKVGNSTMIFPVIDCSFISLFMRLKAVMGNCNSLADHILVISKEFQLFHPFLYLSTPHVTAVQVHPSSFYPSTQVWMQTWWIRWVIYRVFLQNPDGLGMCLSASALPLHVHIPASEYSTSCHSQTDFIPYYQFFFSISDLLYSTFTSLSAPGLLPNKPPLLSLFCYNHFQIQYYIYKLSIT